MRIVPQHAVEGRAVGEILGPADRHRVAQQRLWRHQDQRLAIGPVQLAPQNVEIVRGRRAVRDDPVVFGAKLQKPFQPRAGMFRPLALIAVRQKHHQARHPQPFRFARVDELVDHDLRAIGKIAELRLPDRQGVRFGQ